MSFQGKRVLIVGFGVSGRAAARFFLAKGARVAVTDSQNPPASGGVIDGRLETHWGGHPTGIFSGRDLICVSPGVPLDLPGLKLARRKRIPIWGEFGVAADWIARHWKTPMIAVTGTNGKSTTVTLIAKMIEASGKRVALAGNIGKPLMEVVLEGKGLDWIIAEVSSYQLETAPRFHPRIAVILNITADHLDRYSSLRGYAAAKFRIFGEQTRRDLLLYKEDDPIVRRGVRRARARKSGFSLRDLKAGVIHLGEERYPLHRVRLIGRHNVENMIASIAAAREAGVSPAVIQRALNGFEGLPHRTEFVRERNGVRYYDDSKGTNVDAVVQSLAGFPDGRVILIAGGRDKGGSYQPLRRMAAQKVKCVLLIGEACDRMASALKGSVDVETPGRLERAVSVAASRAKPGDVVLLSPACSSFDQFRDYKERGDLFQRLVREL